MCPPAWSSEASQRQRTSIQDGLGVRFSTSHPGRGASAAIGLVTYTFSLHLFIHTHHHWNWIERNMTWHGCCILLLLVADRSSGPVDAASELHWELQGDCQPTVWCSLVSWSLFRDKVFRACQICFFHIVIQRVNFESLQLFLFIYLLKNLEALSFVTLIQDELLSCMAPDCSLDFFALWSAVCDLDCIWDISQTGSVMIGSVQFWG